MKETLNRLQHNLDSNTPCSASDIQAVVDFAWDRQWVSVQDRLPEEDCRVDAWMPEYNSEYKRVTDVNYDAGSKSFYIDYDLTEMTKYVTHWKHRSSPPENE